MKNKTNQNEKAFAQRKAKQTIESDKKKLTTVKSDVPDDQGPLYPTSLNEELDELLKKNPRRFFGGCGG